MDIKFSNRGSTLVALFTGELDHHFSEYARNKIERELLKATTHNVVFDLTGLSFMDSSGIGVIVGRFAHIKKLGAVLLSYARTQKSIAYLRYRGF